MKSRGLSQDTLYPASTRLQGQAGRDLTRQFLPHADTINR